MPIVISDGLVLASAAAEIPVTHPRVLYDDIFGLSDTTLVASSEAAGFEKENAADYLTYDFWKPTALTATLEAQADEAHAIDYMMIAAHSLGTAGAAAKPQYWNGSAWTDLAAEVAPGADRVLLFLFEEVFASRVRVRVTGGATMPSLGVVMAGKALAMERGLPLDHAPINLSRKTAFAPSESEGGQFLGRSIKREGVETKVTFQHLTESFVRASVDPFIAAARKRPFGFAWSPSRFPDDVAYCHCDQDIKPAYASSQDRMNIEFVITGLAE